MLKLRIKKSLAGFIAGGLFLSLAVGVFCWIFFIASRNPADSGESGIMLLPFAMPWIMWLPVEWLGPLTGLACIRAERAASLPAVWRLAFRYMQPGLSHYPVIKGFKIGHSNSCKVFFVTGYKSQTVN